MHVAERNSQNNSIQYQIKVQGKLNGSWSDWFGGINITTVMEANGFQVTILNGVFPDQAALRYVLIKLWDLNATLIEVQLINPSTGDPFN
jgi:hypothetical protein